MAFIVGIAGGTASGKTFAARKTVQALDKKATLLSQDWFYKEYSEIPKINGMRNFDHPDSFDWSLLKESVKKLKNNESCSVPEYEYEKGRKGYSMLEARQVIIFEGILALHDKELNELFDLKVFVQAPESERFKRRLERDVKERNVPEQTISERLERHVKPMHDLYVEPLKQKADLIIDGTTENSFKKILEKINEKNHGCQL